MATERTNTISEETQVPWLIHIWQIVKYQHLLYVHPPSLFTKRIRRHEQHLLLKTSAMNAFSMKLKIDNVSRWSESIRVMSKLHTNREVYTLNETWLLMIRCKPILAITISFNIIYHCEVTAMVGGYRNWDMKIPIITRRSQIMKCLELMVQLTKKIQDGALQYTFTELYLHSNSFIPSWETLSLLIRALHP